MFSDTLLGDARMVNNCIVVEGAAFSRLQTVLGCTPAEPAALIDPFDNVGPEGLAR